MWKNLHSCNTATIIEQTWGFYLQPIIDIPLGNSIMDSLPIAYGEMATLLQQAINKPNTIGWEKLLLGMETITWKT